MIRRDDAPLYVCQHPLCHPLFVSQTDVTLKQQTSNTNGKAYFWVANNSDGTYVVEWVAVHASPWFLPESMVQVGPADRVRPEHPKCRGKSCLKRIRKF